MWGIPKQQYCQPKEMGGCPITCSANEQICYGTKYNSTTGKPELDKWGMPKSREFCAPKRTSDGKFAMCPCDSSHENTCDMGAGRFSWKECVPKTEGPCPVNCAANNTAECYPMGFKSNGDHDWESNTVVCKPSYDDCMGLCGANSLKCISRYGDYCQWSGGPACPVECDLKTQKECYVDTFDSAGLVTGSNMVC